MRPIYEYGDEVRVLRNVRNDGTFPGQPTGSLLVRRGNTGFVRDVGTFLQDQIVYSVHFIEGDRIVGCREEELQLASAPWTPSRFESREKVAARIALGRSGRVLVEQRRVGEVMKVLREPAPGEQSGEVAYHVLFPGCSLLQVPESALESAPLSASSQDASPDSARGSTGDRRLTPTSASDPTAAEASSPSEIAATKGVHSGKQPAIAEQSP